MQINVFKSKVSNDLDKNLLNYGTFVSGSHLEFHRHFEVLFLKIPILFFLWYILPKYVILLGKYPSYPGKTKITKVHFLMNFVRALPTQELEQKRKIKKNLPTKPVGSFKN
jgi:hypothetical protein